MTAKREITRQDDGLSLLPFTAMRRDMDDIFSRYLPSLFGRETQNGSVAAMNASLDLSETEEGLELEIDAPGIDKDDIDITLSGQTLTVTGSREDKSENKSKDFHRIERTFGSFKRQVMLPCEVDEDKIKAALKDGVLKIELPKSEQAKTSSKKIPIKGL